MSTTTRILVVDDDVAVRGYLEALLVGEGYQVVTAESGQAALEHIAAQPFDLALIDLKMPGVDGMQVLAALRQQTPDTAAIVLTAHGSLETAVEALRYGAYDYLFKPCKTVEIRKSVRAGLHKRQRELRQREVLAQLQGLASSARAIYSSTDEQLSIPPLGSLGLDPELGDEHARFLQRGGLIVDFVRHVITLDGCLLELTPTEFDLLAYIASKAPRVVSPQELVREVQGYKSEAWEAGDIARTHIYNIRQKISSVTGRKDVIRTVRGVGYMMED